ncbi:MAG: hypothetical protein ACI4IG_04170 [Eubacterium sp.]
MKKSKRFVSVIIISVIFFCIFLGVTIYILIPNVLTTNAKRYIENKYNITQTEIVEIENSKMHIEIDFVLLERFDVWVVPARWVFNVNGKSFNVEYFENHYVDDYQLEDLELWCTEYLQNNVDSNITGVELYSDMIFHEGTHNLFSKRYKYYSHLSIEPLPYSDNRLWQKDETEEFLSYQYENYNHLGVFIQASNVSKYSETDINSEYDNLVQSLNSHANNKTCTFTPILHCGELKLERSSTYLYLLCNKMGNSITTDEIDKVIYNFSIYRKDLL